MRSNTLRFLCLDRLKVVSQAGIEENLRPKEADVLWAIIFLLIDGDHLTAGRVENEVWPDVAPGRRLASQLTNLRKKLPGDIGTDPSRSGHVHVYIARDEVDAWLFADLSKRSIAEGDEGLMEAARSLWRSESLALGTTPSMPTRRLIAQRCEMLEQFVHKLSTSGYYLRAVELLEELVGLVPEREDLWLQLVEAESVSHGRAAGLSVVRRGQAVLADLGFPASEVLEAARRKLLKSRAV